MIRLDSLGDLPPLEDRGPLQSSGPPAEGGQDVRQLGQCWDFDKQHFTILDDFVRKVLSDVNVLGPFSSTNDVVSPLDACQVILVDWCGFCWAKSSRSSKYWRYKTSITAVDAE